jgi:hypothetical protein
MPDYVHYNRETAADRARLRERVAEIMSGERDKDGLTNGERELLWRCQQQGIEIAESFPYNRRGVDYWQPRVLRKVQFG